MTARSGAFPDERVSARMWFDGGSVVSTLRLDRGEDRRRVKVGMGAVTSRALLHGLWLLPAGVAVPTSDVPDVKLGRLRDADGCVIDTGRELVRTYSPPGSVERLTFVGSNPDSLVRRAVRSAPIFERHVVIRSTGPITINSAICAEATEWGVGITVATSDETLEVVPVGPAVLGVPTVYRWWIAEVAYDAVLYENAQLLSWTAASTRSRRRGTGRSTPATAGGPIGSSSRWSSWTRNCRS